MPTSRSWRQDRSTSSDTGLIWHLLFDEEPRNGADNMALDHALTECLPAGEAVLRLYAWNQPTVSFGRNEQAVDRYDPETASEEGLGLVRRPTGGRAVLHSGEVTYAVAIPSKALGGARRAYSALGHALVRGLKLLGVSAELSSSGVILPPDAGPCFRDPAPGEVVSAGRKLAGSAQVRLGGNILQHGSVILTGDQAALARLQGGSIDPFPPATVEAAMGRPVPWDEAARALQEGFRLALGGTWRKRGYRSEERIRADRLREERYATEAWTWRR